MALVIKITSAFERKASKIMTAEVREELYDYLYEYPAIGDVIAGTGGVRKLRWRTGKNNKGKSGGVRILYHYTQNVLVLLIMLYEKADQENISQAEKNILKAEIPKLVRAFVEELKP